LIRVVLIRVSLGYGFTPFFQSPHPVNLVDIGKFNLLTAGYTYYGWDETVGEVDQDGPLVSPVNLYQEAGVCWR
jgi:hypothetical protein